MGKFDWNADCSEDSLFVPIEKNRGNSLENS